MVNIKNRQFRKEDVDDIHQIALESWKKTYKDIFDDAFIQEFVDTHYGKEALLSVLPFVDQGEHFFQVATDKNTVVGFCHIGDRGNGMELFRIYIEPSYIGKGVGKSLIAQEENFIKSKKADSYFCFVHQDNELGKNFYIRNGFVHIPENDKDGEWHMKKVIESS